MLDRLRRLIRAHRRLVSLGSGLVRTGLVQIARLRAQLQSAASCLQRFGLAAPRPGQWETAYAVLRDEARALVTDLNAALETDIVGRSG